jgi:glycogen synthase
MLACLGHALTIYEDSSRWRQIQLRAMGRQSGWMKAASEYLALYEGLVGKREPDGCVHHGGTTD